jgi:mannose-6-phosphate isomerase
MFVPDQPLRFIPQYRSYIWGGERLSKRMGKNTPDGGIWAESWEIVDHREGESTVEQGPWEGWTLRKLIESHPLAILGQESPNERFPLLLKYLDCQRVLSVQVHPDDAYGASMPQPDRGKTEAWYVVEADPGAVLYAGLKRGVDRPTLERAVTQGTTEECLHAIHPQPGDCVFIPAGTVHALGSGLIVAEIQQASDCTFRLFDWNRVDKDGMPRPLHIAHAFDVIDFDRGPITMVARQPTEWHQQSLLVDCDKFRLFECRGQGDFPLAQHDFSIVTMPLGSGLVQTQHASFPLTRGQSLLIPAACQDAVLHLPIDALALIATPPSTQPPRSERA